MVGGVPRGVYPAYIPRDVYPPCTPVYIHQEDYTHHGAQVPLYPPWCPGTLLPTMGAGSTYPPPWVARRRIYHPGSYEAYIPPG